MAVVNIPPNNNIYALGKIAGALYVYNMGKPRDGNQPTTYSVTITNVNAWPNVQIAIGHMHNYVANNNAAYIQNEGPSTLQVLYLDNTLKALSPEEAGIGTVPKAPLTE